MKGNGIVNSSGKYRVTYPLGIAELEERNHINNEATQL